MLQFQFHTSFNSNCGNNKKNHYFVCWRRYGYDDALHATKTHQFLQYFCIVLFWVEHSGYRQQTLHTICHIIKLNNCQHIVFFIIMIIHLPFLDKHGKRWTSLKTQTVLSVLIKNECTSSATSCLLDPKTMWSLCRIFRCLVLHHRVNTQHGKFFFSFLSCSSFL